jgi:2'-5' RNA ligase
MFAIFLEPDFRLRNFIKVLKKDICKKYKNSTFTNHPPHCTIFYSLLSNNKLALKSSLNILKKNINIKILCNKYSTFSNSPVKNETTLFIKIKTNKKLSKLQLDLAKNLSNQLKKNYVIKNKKKYKKQIVKNSFLKYGFPYVGRHWIPHFTIGTVRNKDNFLISDFLKHNKSFAFKAKHITFWKVNKDKHILLGKQKLY